MAKTIKRDKYRKLLEQIFKQVTKNSNWEDFKFGNSHVLILYDPYSIRDYLQRFEEIKKER